MSKSVIIDGVRSPIGLKNGKLFNEEIGIVTRADDLSSNVLKALLDRVGADKNIYEDFVLGCAFPEGPQGMLMARGVTVLSDLPDTIAAIIITTSNTHKEAMIMDIILYIIVLKRSYK